MPDTPPPSADANQAGSLDVSGSGHGCWHSLLPSARAALPEATHPAKGGEEQSGDLEEGRVSKFGWTQKFGES
jgi:hypothetical protein